LVEGAEEGEEEGGEEEEDDEVLKVVEVDAGNGAAAAAVPRSLDFVIAAFTVVAASRDDSNCMDAISPVPSGCCSAALASPVRARAPSAANKKERRFGLGSVLASMTPWFVAFALALTATEAAARRSVADTSALPRLAVGQRLEIRILERGDRKKSR